MSLRTVAVLVATLSLAGCPRASSSSVERSYEAAIVACAGVGLPDKYDRATDMRCRAAVDCVYHVGPCSTGGGK